MAFPVGVDSVENGDRIEVWLNDRPAVVVVTGIEEGKAIRTCQARCNDQTLTLDLQRGQTVNLAC